MVKAQVWFPLVSICSMHCMNDIDFETLFILLVNIYVCGCKNYSTYWGYNLLFFFTVFVNSTQMNVIIIFFRPRKGFIRMFEVNWFYYYFIMVYDLTFCQCYITLLWKRTIMYFDAFLLLSTPIYNILGKLLPLTIYKSVY